MRESITNLALFVCFCLVFSSLTACTGTTANSGPNNGPQPPRADSGPKGDSIYPAIPSGLASAEMELLDGKKVKVSDKTGKALILNLWAIWCGYCREEMPHLQEMQKQYSD